MSTKTVTRILHVTESKEVDDKGKEKFIFESTISTYNELGECTGSEKSDGAKFASAFPSAASVAAQEKKADDEKSKDARTAQDVENTQRAEGQSLAKSAADKKAAADRKASDDDSLPRTGTGAIDQQRVKDPSISSSDPTYPSSDPQYPAAQTKSDQDAARRRAGKGPIEPSNPNPAGSKNPKVR